MFEDILNSFIDPILVIDKGKRIKYLNASFEEIFHVNSNFILNKNLSFIIDEDSPLFLLINKTIKEGITIKAVIIKNKPQSPFNQSTKAPEDAAKDVLPAVPIEANKAY